MGFPRNSSTNYHTYLDEINELMIHVRRSFLVLNEKHHAEEIPGTLVQSLARRRQWVIEQTGFIFRSGHLVEST